MSKFRLGLTLMAVLLLSPVAVIAEESQVIIEEEATSPGNVGVQGNVSDDGFNIRFKVKPESTYRKKTTITTKGATPQTEIRVYTEYPGCDPPCDREYCYPSSHTCHGCNRYHPSPCPPY